MQDQKNKYWRGVEELDNTPEFAKHAHNEFPEYLPILGGEPDANGITSSNRRDFLKLMGFGVAAASLAACEAPVKKAIPYLNKPEEIDPSIANWYASTYCVGGDYNSILVKTREGRPIKLEGNPESPITRGGLSARAQASVLSLYDEARVKGPRINHKDATWEQVDREVTAKLQGLKGKLAIVSSTVVSPSTKRVIREFMAMYPSAEHVQYDANSAAAMLKANQASTGKMQLASYDFSKAMAIVSVGADFLGTWLSPVEYARQYIVNRKVTADKPQMSKHYQFECMMSITGATADVRIPTRPSEEGAIVAALYNKIVGGSLNAAGASKHQKMVDEAASALMNSKGAALVVSNHKDAGIQFLVNEINKTLGAYGTTINPDVPSYLKQGDDTSMMRLISEIGNNQVGGVIFYDCNPAYDHPMAKQLIEGLKNVDLRLSFSDREDETAVLCQYLAPDHHYLESWNDFEPKRGFFSLAQPVISPLFNTRQMQDSLLVWGGSNTDYYTTLRNNWRGMATGNFMSFWDKTVHDGVFQAAGSASVHDDMPAASGASVSVATASAALDRDAAMNNGLQLALYETVGMGIGNDANNPWLLELPDPVTKACWDNYLCITRAMAKDKGWEQGNLVKVSTNNGVSATLPVLIQPGLPANTVAIAIGYGRTHAGPAAKGVGINAFQFASGTENGISFTSVVKDVTRADGNRDIAQTQTHQTIMDRLVVQDNSLANYKKDPTKVTEYIRTSTPLSPTGEDKPTSVSLWKDYEYKNHHWGMVIDLNSCIGCNSCMVGCQAENNVPVVGRQEVLNRREMHWLRIDRYYSSDKHHSEGASYTEMEDPSDNPTVIFQPMMCQHCNHAPCETVCPVLATTHSTEGLNQMTYNRCIGTRYCANNCPYKVRRFNWFNYQNDERVIDVNLTTELQRMVLNPDVTVRSRGVMEKCSFCVQRIQLGKLEAKKERRRPQDGEIVTACAQSCPTNAIIFGDMNDPESQVAKILRREDGQRAFHVLEELNVQPNVTYLTRIRNSDKQLV